MIDWDSILGIGFKNKFFILIILDVVALVLATLNLV